LYDDEENDAIEPLMNKISRMEMQDFKRNGTNRMDSFG
jgi:hypothetical protein